MRVSKSVHQPPITHLRQLVHCAAEAGHVLRGGERGQRITKPSKPTTHDDTGGGKTQNRGGGEGGDLERDARLALGARARARLRELHRGRDVDGQLVLAHKAEVDGGAHEHGAGGSEQALRVGKKNQRFKKNGAEKEVAVGRTIHTWQHA